MKQHEARCKFENALKLCDLDLWKKKLFLRFEPCIDVSFTSAEQFNNY